MTKDITHPCFRPVWVEGKNESRLGYVLELSYPSSVVYVQDCGAMEVKNNKLHFLLSETHWKIRNFVYGMYGLDGKPCTAETVVKLEIAA